MNRLTLSVAALLMLLNGCSPAQPEQSTVKNVRPVKLADVPASYAAQNHNFVAQVRATERAQLAFQVSGELEEMPVRMGARVTKGQLLAQLDPVDYQLAVAARQAEFSLANVHFQRALSLHEKQLISDDEFDQSETSLAAARTALEQARTDLGYTHLYAPFDGVISLVYVKAFQNVAANQPILNIQGRNSFDVLFSLPVHLTKALSLERLKKGKYSVHLSHFDGLELPAFFREISTQPDPDTNSYTVTLTVSMPKDLNIVPGMSGKVRFEGERGSEAPLVLGADAFVTREGDLAQLWRVDKSTNHIEAVIVEVDAKGRVLSGLEAGDRIVVAGADQLTAGQQIKAWEREGGI